MDWGALVQGIAQIGTNIMNAAGMEINRRTAFRNLSYQFKANQENAIWNLLQMNREDTAVQRRVADLKAAGLSPTLAAGSAAQSTQPIRVMAPHNEYKFDPITAPDILGTFLQSAQTRAQIDLQDAQTSKIRQSTLLDLASFPERMKLLSSKNAALFQEVMFKAFENEMYRFSGVNPRTGSQLGKSAVDVTAVMDTFIKGLMGERRSYPIDAGNKLK